MSGANSAILLDKQRLARVRYRRLRSLLMDIRPFALIAGALTALLLGLVGFSQSTATASGDLGDDLYRAVRLFGFQGGDLPPHVATELQIARVLAPLVVGYAAIAGLIALFRDQALLLRLRLFARRHIVVVGLSDTGFRLASALAKTGLRVVVIERNRAHAALAGCRNRGIAVVFGDGADPEVQSNARCDRALHVFACSGSDAGNLRILAACAELSRDPGWLPSTAHVFIESPFLWHGLLAAPLKMQTRGLRVDFLSVSDLAGRALADAEPTIYAGEGPAHIVALARGSIGASAAGHVLRRLILHERELSVTLIGPEAASDRDALLKAAPWVERAASIEAVLVDPTEPATTDQMLFDDMTAALVCDDDVARGLATAQGLVAMTLTSDAPVLTLTDDDELARSLGQTGMELDRIIAVGGIGRILGPALLHDTVVEAVARASHENYVRNELERGEDPSTNPSLVAWDVLPEPLKESNRRFADDLARKIPRLRGRIAPRDPTLPPPADLELPADVLGELAEQEHKRWVSDLVADGWQPTTGPKDPDHDPPLHPLLVSWDQLPDSVREKDREAIRELPKILAAAGYSLTVDSRVPVHG